MNPHLTALQAIIDWSDITSAEWDREYPVLAARYIELIAKHEDDELLATRDLFIEIARVGMVSRDNELTADAATVSPSSAVSPAGHTPAPWTIIPARPHEEIEGAFEAFAGIEGADGSPVCLFGDGAGSATMFENEADYHLISAAPELLKALEHLAELFADLAPLGEQTTREVALVNARAAILKATGTTPNIKSEG